MPTVCSSCGDELPTGARFCPKDGATVSAPPAEKPVDPLLGRVIDGRYRVRAPLGSGGVGAVYEGEHVEIKKTVAIKVLHGLFASTEDFRRRFEREARAASRLDHPSCVTVIDFGRVSRLDPMDGAVGLLGIPYLVMEFVRGRVLVERMGDAPRLSAGESAQIALGILAGLKHAHGLGIVHRDVKPANVMLLAGDEGVRTKLLDFGLAKDLGGAVDEEEDPLTQAGTVFGTPSYLSPEQASGKKADARSDLYSAGVVLFEMVCARRPFVREEPLDVVRDHLNTPPPSPRAFAQLSEELERVILRALEKDPEARFQSAEEFAAALAATPELRAPAPVPLDVARVLRRRWPFAAAGALLLPLGMWWALRRPAPPPAAAAPPSLPVMVVSHEAQAHLSLAGDYQRKLWCSDALEELERALRADESLKRDPEVARIAISCLTPKTRDKAVRFLVERLGAAALAPLRQATAGDDNPEVKKGAERALSRLAGNPAEAE